MPVVIQDFEVVPGGEGGQESRDAKGEETPKPPSKEELLRELRKAMITAHDRKLRLWAH